MLILHGAIDKGNLCLWIEKKISPSSSLKRARGRKPINPPPELHPFSGNSEEVSTLLSPFFLQKKEGVKGLIYLPSNERRPLPSSPILEETPSFEKEKKLKHAPWVVITHVLEPKEALLFLLTLSSKDMLTHGTVLGKEFAFLVALTEFTLSLIIRERYLPTVLEEEEGFVSSWAPIFLGKDKERLSQLKTILPCCCRALTLSLKQKSPPCQTPEKVIERFIGKAIHFFTSENQPERKFIPKSSHDQWLQALINKDQSLNIADSEGHTLKEAALQWQNPLKNTSSSPFKLCFRLEEPLPESEESSWNVSYLLQAYDDPSLIATTADVWNPKGVKRKVLKRPNFNPQQFVLASLGVAIHVCEGIKQSLESKIPKGFSLDNKGAFHFLDHDAYQLEELGFGVICPNWWSKDKLKLSAKAFIESPFKHKAKESIWDGINTDWQIFLGNIKISIEELKELALLKEPLVNMRGKWTVLHQEEIQKALEFLKKPYEPKNLLDLLQIDGGISERTYGISVEGLKAKGWIQDFLKSLKNNQTIKILKQPKIFKGSLRPYQRRGYSWMSFLKKWRIGACLADDMGLGKTPQTLALVTQDWEERKKKKPSLLVCPTSLLGNWSHEAIKFVPDLPIYVHHGPDRATEENFTQEADQQGLVITSYALLHRDLKLFQNMKWSGIILDEAQNIKNSQTKQAKAAYELESEYRLALTGTPVENNVGDLWSLMHFLNPGYLGTQDSFREAFFKPIQVKKDVEAISNLKRLTTPFILRRLKTDRSIISDLPDKIETNSYCSLTSEQISLYESVVENANTQLAISEGIERKGIILATLGKLKQICNHPVNFLKDGSLIEGRSGKLLRLEEILEEVYAIGDRSLIFTQYTEMGNLLKDYLQEKQGEEVLFLHGGIRKKDRDAMVEKFQQKKQGPSLFILSIKAGGVGLNLTRANHVIHFDRWWNPAVENQATDRAFRIGQKKNVQVHKLISSGTIEERIDSMIANKKEIAQNTIGEGEGWLTELSNENLKELWKLQTTLMV